MSRLPHTRLWAVVVAMAIACCCCAEATAAPSQPYEVMLYELGAFPVAKLTKPYFDNGHPGQVYGKGERLDVEGWLPPYWTPSYLTNAEKIRYGIPKEPLSYGRYLAMLDIDTYRRTHDPTLFLVMRFTLDRMVQEQVPVRREDILRVYEARIGLEEFAVPLLVGKLSSGDAMRLVRTYGDERLFDALPLAQPQDSAYIAFLNEQAGAVRWSVHVRQETYRLLMAVDGQRYRKAYQTFLLKNVKTGTDWSDRANLYAGLIELKDEESFQAVREGLAHDPITECRESILYHLQQQGEVASVIDAILVVVNRQDAKHHAVTVSRMPNGWSYRLGEYLKWAKSQAGMDAATLRKVDQAIGTLKTMHPTDEAIRGVGTTQPSEVP